MTMSAPFVLITKHRFGKENLAEVMGAALAYGDQLRENEPSMLSFTATIDEDAAEVSFVHVLTDAAAADEHLGLAREHIGRGLTISETSRIEVFGTPGPAIVTLLAGNAERGVPVSVSSASAGGFSRRVVALEVSE